MRGKYTGEAQNQGREMLAVLERIRPGAAERLKDDPLAELANWEELAVVLVEEPPGADRCSVAGSYRPDPPTLLVTQAVSWRRNGFTALHELGHHLQQTDPHLGGLTFTVSDSQALEEEACDAFAAQILLPDAELSGGIGPRGPVARDVADLVERLSASREACCVWAARHLQGAGAVVLLDSSGTVLFAASKSFIPPARKSDQSSTSLITAALENPGGHVTRDSTHVLYRNKGTSDPLFGQAVWLDDRYLVAIVVTDSAPWSPLSLPRPFGGHHGRAWWACETCEEEFRITEHCGQCQQPRCPNSHCGCDATRAAREKLCSRCSLKLPPTLFPDGGFVCRDCA